MDKIELMSNKYVAIENFFGRRIPKIFQKFKRRDFMEESLKN